MESILRFVLGWAFRGNDKFPLKFLAKYSSLSEIILTAVDKQDFLSD